MMWTNEDNIGGITVAAAAMGSNRRASVRNIRSRKVGRERPALNPVDGFLGKVFKKMGEAVIKVTTKDPVKEAQKLAELDAKHNKLMNSGVGKVGEVLSTIAGGVALGATGAKGIQTVAQSLKKPAQPTLNMPGKTSIDTSGFKPGAVTKPALAPSIFQSVPTATSTGLADTIMSSPSNPNPLFPTSGKAPTGSGLIDTVIQAAESISPEERQSIIERGEDLLNKGTGILTRAQTALQNAGANVGLLPKTQRLKDAERLAAMPYNEASIMGSGSSSMWVIGGGIALVIVVVLVMALKK